MIILRRFSAFSAFALAILAAPAAALASAYHAIERGIGLLFDTLAPAFVERAVDRDSRDGEIPALIGHPFDPSLINGLRHESGFFRIAAARGG